MSVKKNFLYNSAYQVLTIILPLITAPYLSRVLGADGIGIYSYTYSMACYFVMFAMMGTSTYGQREIARCRDNRADMSHAFWSIWFLQCAAALLAVAVYVAYALLASDTVLVLVWIPYVLSAGLDINWLFFGREEFKVTVIRNFIVKLGTFSLMFAIVRGEHALLAYLILMSASYFVSVAVLWPMLRKRVDFYRPKFSEVLAHLRPNLVLFLPIIAVSFYTVFDKVMLGSISGMTEAGYFENATKIAAMPFSLITALGVVMLPHMTALFSKHESEAMRRYMGASMWFVTMLSLAFSFGLAGIAEVFSPVFFGSGFDPCSFLICVIVLDMPFKAWANVLRTQYLVPSGRDRAFVTSIILGATANVALNFVLIPMFASFGAAIALVAAEIVVCIVQVWVVREELPQGKWLRESLPSLFIGIFMCVVVRFVGATLGTNVLSLVIQIVVGVVLFSLLTWAWCTLTHNQYYELFILPTFKKYLARFSRRANA